MATTYHVWFATKRRAWLLQEDVGQAAKEILRQVAREKGFNLLECETAVDHVHLLLRLADGESLSKAMNLLKGTSSYRLHAQFPDLKLDSGLNRFWQRGYAFRIVARGSLTARRRYVRTQQERLDSFADKSGCRVL